MIHNEYDAVMNNILRDARYCVNTKLLCKYMIIVGRE